MVYIEAENFSFGGGNYFDDLVLCNDFGGTVTGCYFDRVSEQGVDAMDVNGTTDDRDFNLDAIPPEIFRFGSASREERVDTFLSTDVTRDAYANADEGSNGTIEDYDLELIAPGDWWNYTRTLDEGSYSAILRVSSASDATFELGLVTSNASQANQTVETIGQFSVTGRPGYQSITITDSDGALAAFDANGESTLRLTAVDGEDAVINDAIRERQGRLRSTVSLATAFGTVIGCTGIPTGGRWRRQATALHEVFEIPADGTGFEEPVSSSSKTKKPPRLSMLPWSAVACCRLDRGGTIANQGAQPQPGTPSACFGTCLKEADVRSWIERQG